MRHSATHHLFRTLSANGELVPPLPQARGAVLRVILSEAKGLLFRKADPSLLARDDVEPVAEPIEAI